MGATHVSGQDVSVEGTSFAASVTTGAFPSSTISGNAIVVWASWYTGGGSTAPTISDANGNTYTKLVQADGAVDSVGIWVCKNITGGAAHTVTATANGGSTLTSLAASEYSGQNTVTQAGGTSTGTGTGTTTASAGSVTPANGDIAVAAVTHATDNAPAITAGSGWTRRANIVGNSGVCLGSEDQAGTGASVSADFSFGASLTHWSACVAVIQAAGGGTTAPSLLPLLGVG